MKFRQASLSERDEPPSMSASGQYPQFAKSEILAAICAKQRLSGDCPTNRCCYHALPWVLDLS